MKAVLRAVGYALLVAAAVLWFVAIWTHGSDVPQRLSGSGVLAALLGALAVLAGWE